MLLLLRCRCVEFGQDTFPFKPFGSLGFGDDRDNFNNLVHNIVEDANIVNT